MNGYLAGLALAVLIATHWGAYSHGVSVENKRHIAAVSQATVKAITSARKTEQRQAEAIHVGVTNAQTAAAATTDNADALDRLRDANADLRRRLSDAATAAQRGEAASRAGMVYAELLDRANERIAGLERVAGRAAELAKLYDTCRIRGELATGIYDSQLQRRQ